MNDLAKVEKQNRLDEDFKTEFQKAFRLIEEYKREEEEKERLRKEKEEEDERKRHEQAGIDPEYLFNEFIDKHIRCRTCVFFETELFGYSCTPPADPGEKTYTMMLSNDAGLCEMHEFRDSALQKQYEELQGAYLEHFDKVFFEPLKKGLISLDEKRRTLL